MNITLSKITRDNYEEVCELEVAKDQEEYVAENTWSLVQASFNPSYETRAICLEGKPVGFFMWVPEPDGAQSIWRFMVDRQYQNKGIGRRALEIALEEIKAVGLKRILILYDPKNAVARDFYSSFGFVEIGMDEDIDEMLAEITI
ncbi:GNAT family N-acetyltransferase [Serratia liquefaciens]|uniref:GNAT family N-acetyltransferase n=1 Tax=Serratia liquefaciens TaxID=614 RepID=UPI0021570689|nr:GNAT family N-acetyltransferase [Serratia liquefaciens]